MTHRCPVSSDTEKCAVTVFFFLVDVAVRRRAVTSSCACTCLFSQSTICLLFLCRVELSSSQRATPTLLEIF